MHQHTATQGAGWIELRCAAPHPRLREVARFAKPSDERMWHGIVLVTFPAEINGYPVRVRFKGRYPRPAGGEIAKHPGCIPARCDCGWVTEWEILDPAPAQPAPVVQVVSLQVTKVRRKLNKEAILEDAGQAVLDFRVRRKLKRRNAPWDGSGTTQSSSPEPTATG